MLLLLWSTVVVVVVIIKINAVLNSRCCYIYVCILQQYGTRALWAAISAKKKRRRESQWEWDTCFLLPHLAGIIYSPRRHTIINALCRQGSVWYLYSHIQLPPSTSQALQEECWNGSAVTGIMLYHSAGLVAHSSDRTMADKPAADNKLGFDQRKASRIQQDDVHKVFLLSGFRLRYPLPQGVGWRQKVWVKPSPKMGEAFTESALLTTWYTFLGVSALWPTTFGGRDGGRTTQHFVTRNVNNTSNRHFGTSTFSKEP